MNEPENIIEMKQVLETALLTAGQPLSLDAVSYTHLLRYLQKNYSLNINYMRHHNFLLAPCLT